MKKSYLFLISLIATSCFGQADRKLSALLSFQVNRTTNDRTISNNSAGIGFGLQTHLNTNTWIKPTLEINADLFGGTKELRLTADGRPIDAKSEVVGIYVGPMFQLTKSLFLSTTVGKSIFNKKSHFGVRPSVVFYPSKSRKWAVKVAYTGVFQRDDISNENFGYLSFALALKLF